MIDKLVGKYTKFILNLTPSNSWIIARFFLHWFSLPIKLILMGLWSIGMHIYMFQWKKRSIESQMSPEERKQSFLKIYNNLPIYRNLDLQLHVNRVPYEEPCNGSNHNDDHQAARHGTYSFLMSRLHLRNTGIDSALRLHYVDNTILRGYKFDQSGIVGNFYDCSGDQLVGLTLAMLDDCSENLRNKFINSVEQIIDNDYSLKSADGTRKSSSANWQPGLETVGAQALTILCALKVAAKFGSKKSKKAYNKLLWLYGYGLLSLIPTTFSLSNRNYSNDHNCIVSAYILAKQSWGFKRFYWFMVMLYCWSLSYKWCNGYFTGLVQDIYPIFTKKYIQRCKDYLYEEIPNDYAKSIYWHKWEDGKVYPVKFNDMNQGEFHCDEPHQVRKNDQLTKSGLGWLAHAIMIDPKEAKEFFKS